MREMYVLLHEEGERKMEEEGAFESSLMLLFKKKRFFPFCGRRNNPNLSLF